MNEIEVAERLAALEKDEESVHRRLDNLEKLVESVHIIATELKTMRSDVNEINTRVEDIEKKPQKRLDSIVITVFASTITAIIGAIIGHFIK